MMRSLFAVALLACACSSSSSDGTQNEAQAGAGSMQGCPDVSGTWTITAHCQSDFIGQHLTITESNCVLSFAPPYDVFSGSVTADDKINLSGAQTCSGSASATAVSMNCTGGPTGTGENCPVKLAR